MSGVYKADTVLICIWTKAPSDPPGSERWMDYLRCTGQEALRAQAARRLPGLNPEIRFQCVDWISRRLLSDSELRAR